MKVLVSACLFLVSFVFSNSSFDANPLSVSVIKSIEETEIARAKAFLYSPPITVTDAYSERSAGGIHDFYTEGDYLWPNPKDPKGPYIRKDGKTNPENFTAHRIAMIRLSEIVATLTSAWLITEEEIYAKKAQEHLVAWFVKEETKMNPNMLYAQAIFGKVTGRGIGLIDACHLVEVVQSVRLLSEKGGLTQEVEPEIKKWFGEFLEWMTTHEYGISEMNWKNNHGTCWAVTAASMAVLTENKEIIELCTQRFKEVLLPNQMAENGSFPLELERSKPYGYSLFNIDAFCNLAQVLSTAEENLFEYKTEDGKSIKKGLEFIFPYMIDKSKWPYAKDVFIWNEWPVSQSSLLFAGIAYDEEKYIDTYLSLPNYPIHNEVIRNLPVRHPAIWIME